MYNIYLISSKIGNIVTYKIGYTKRDPSIRVKEMKTGNASELEVVDSFRSIWGPKIEATLKRNFKQYNVSGEWFNLPEVYVESFSKNCEFIHNNFELLSIDMF